ncbi:MAG: hypothetical protein AAGC55_25315, partial [Myxococcota bacterium]
PGDRLTVDVPAIGHSAEAAPGLSDADIRGAIAAIPLDRLRQAGLLNALLSIANSAASSADVPDASLGDAPAIDDMDVEDLVNLALSGQNEA